MKPKVGNAVGFLHSLGESKETQISFYTPSHRFISTEILQEFANDISQNSLNIEVLKPLIIKYSQNYFILTI